MAFYNEKEQLYLETAVLGVGLEGSVLPARDRMWFSRNEAHDRAALLSIAFTSKSMVSAETHFGNAEREVLDILHGLQNSTTTTLPMW